MQTVLPAEVILNPSTQLGANCSEYRSHLPQIENGGRIDFKKLDEWIEHLDVQKLDISTIHPIFIEIKKMFEVILTMDRSVMDGWKYRQTFFYVDEDHYDKNKNRIAQFVQMDWMNSFVTSFIMHLYH